MQFTLAHFISFPDFLASAYIIWQNFKGFMVFKSLWGLGAGNVREIINCLV